MKVYELIKKLEEIKEKHGDLDVYTSDDARIFKYNSEYSPQVRKIYTQKWEDAEHMRDELSDGNIEEKNEDLYDVNLNKPIFTAVLL